jgi:hypothetical protein
MVTIHRVKLDRLFTDLDGKIGSVIFTKRDGTERKMNFRLGVRKGLKACGASGQLTRTPADRYGTPYVIGYDMQINEYRMINLSTVKAVYANGTCYHVLG